MARANLCVLGGMLLLLGACSAFSPYVDRRRNAGAPPEQLYVGRSTKTNPSICYNILTTDYPAVKKLADDECIKHKTGNYAEPVSQEAFSCKLLLPARINFKCITK